MLPNSIERLVFIASLDFCHQFDVILELPGNVVFLSVFRFPCVSLPSVGGVCSEYRMCVAILSLSAVI